MAGAGAGADQTAEGPGNPGAAPGGGPGAWRDWGNALRAELPIEVLAKIAEKHVAQTEAGWAAHLKRFNPDRWTEERIQRKMEQRKRDGNCCLFVFARVCKEWRKAQLKVGGPLRTRVESDVLLPGSVALAKWALAEGCPREDGDGFTMAHDAASFGHLELVKWLCGAGGFAMDEKVMMFAAHSGNLQLVQWLRGEGCPWDASVCRVAIQFRLVKALEWLRTHGCPWDPPTKALAAADLGYTDQDWGDTSMANCWRHQMLAEVLPIVAKKLVAQNEAAWAAGLKGRGRSDGDIHREMAKRKREGHSLFAFAMVYRAWRKVQLEVGGKLFTRVESDLILPGRVELVEWALAQGCPRRGRYRSDTLACGAAEHGRLELVQWLCGKQGLAMNEQVMTRAARSGNLRLVQWLSSEGCEWDSDGDVCWQAAKYGHVEVLRWARQNDCPWTAATRDHAAAKLGYTDDFGNLVSCRDIHGHYIQ